MVTKELSSRVSRIVNDIEDLAHLLLDLREGQVGWAGIAGRRSQPLTEQSALVITASATNMPSEP